MTRTYKYILTVVLWLKTTQNPEKVWVMIFLVCDRSKNEKSFHILYSKTTLISGNLCHIIILFEDVQNIY